MFDRQQMHKTILMSLVCLVVFSGCAGKKVETGEPVAKPAETTIGFKKVESPPWVTKGSGAFQDGGKKVFYGVGSASGIKNYSLLRSTADNRARNEVAKTFETYVASLMKDYAASTTAGDFSETSEEQHVEQAIKTVSSMTLSGVQIIDHWESPENQGLIFSLAMLDLNEFEQNLDKAKELNSKVKDYVRENAGKLHDELSKEVEKREEKAGQ
ncbi:MAG: LPP20 family lipoprotein [bacterium]